MQSEKLARETNQKIKEWSIVVISAYVFISELYWLIQTVPELLGPNGLNLWTPFNNNYGHSNPKRHFLSYPQVVVDMVDKILGGSRLLSPL